jgi:DNA mismatch repair protein MSH5
MDKTKSPVGRKLLKRWFLSPILDRPKREERLDAIAFFQAPEHLPIFQELHQTIRFVKDVERILYRIKAVRASLMDWVKLFQSIVNVLKISELIQPFRSKHPIFNDILNGCTPDLLAISNEMYQMIDFDESKEQKRLVPREGIDSRLDELKNTYNGLEAFLTELGEEELEKLSAAPIYNIRCVYYPQVISVSWELKELHLLFLLHRSVFK